MNLSTILKSILVEKSIQQQELTNVLNLASRQAVNNKFASNSWSVKDLIKVITFLDGKIIIQVNNREIAITNDLFEK